jgi:aryl carrier-like protein
MTQRTGLSPAKRALRESRLRGQYRAPPITRRAREGDPRLSFPQERLWFIDRLQPGGTAFNLNAALRLPGETDERALERALGEIVRRHEALRTVFREVDGVPVHLAARLPDYMVPAALVRLDALPLTPNGKLDCGALPAPGAEAYATRGYEAPAGETEAELAEIWSALLRVERVGRQDNFFALGGHSLLVLQVIEGMRARGYQAEAGALFATPVLADLAAATHGIEEVRL